MNIRTERNSTGTEMRMAPRISLRQLTVLSAIMTSALSVAHAGTFGIIIDCSSSMTGNRRAEAAKEGAKLFTAVLGEQDVLHIVGFSDAANNKTFELTTGLKRKAAMDWIDALPVAGGTDYLGALQAVSWPDGCAIVFISDGEHEAGPPQDVVKFVEQRLGKRIAIHSIAVGCKRKSEAERLLQQMAAATGGSFASVEKSEDLVKQLVQTAVNIGRYRSYLPQQTEIRLNASGRLYAFAYDGQPEVTAQPNVQYVRQHQASLPGPDVGLQVATLANRSNVILRLTSPTSQHSRLGEIHRDDLPIAKIEIKSRNGKLAAGENADARIVFTDRDGNILDPATHPELAGQIAVVDEKGHVVARVPALQSVDQPNLAASFLVPKDSGTITVHAKSIVRTPEGYDFSQRDAKTLAIEQPLILVTNPARLDGQFRAGTITRKLAVKYRDSQQLPESIAARMAREVAGLTLVGADSSAGELAVTFSAMKPGVYQGEFVVSASGSIPSTSARVPFEFKIQPKFVGLVVPKDAEPDFGTRPAGSGPAGIDFQLVCDEEEAVTYSVHVSDLVSGNFVVPMRIDATTIAPTRVAPARLKASIDVRDVPAGIYTGHVTASTTVDGKPHEWQIGVRLTVSEPLLAEPIDLGVVEVGSIVDGLLRLSNLANHRVSEVSVIASREFAGTNSKSTEDLAVQLAINKIAVEAQAIRELPIKVAISPLLKETGEFYGALVVRRGRTKALEVPIKLNVVPEGKGPAPFSVAPETLSADGKRGDVLEFLLRIKPTARLKSTQRLLIEVGQFQVDGQDTQVAADSKWIRGPELSMNGVAEVKVFVLAPQRAGVYRGHVILRGRSSGQFSVPVVFSIP